MLRRKDTRYPTMVEAKEKIFAKVQARPLHTACGNHPYQKQGSQEVKTKHAS